MARGFTLLLTVLLLAGVPGFGQIILGPGGGYPGRRNPQGGRGGRPPGSQPGKSATTFIGMLRKIGDNNVVIESDDKSITTISTASSTKYFNTSGGSAKIGDFQPGDHVNVSANQDNKSVYHAVTMTMVWEGTPEEHSAASAATGDTSRPISSKSSVGAESKDVPVLRRAAPSSDDAPRAQTASDSDRPQLKRASAPPAPAPEPVVTRMPQRMPVTGDPFIDQTREAAFAFSETLPNYVVKQFTTRYATAPARGGGTSWQALDNVTADVIEEDGTEKYKNILINGKPPMRDVEKSGSWSRGEFSSLLQDVLSPLTNADFRGKRGTTIVNRAALRYEFSVEQANSHWHIEADSQNYMPAYTGSIWIDKENYRVLRIEMSAQGMPREFPLDQIEWAVDYDYVLIGEGKYLLPVHSESLSCARAGNQCTKNVIEFRNYRKFTADTSITFEPDE